MKIFITGGSGFVGSRLIGEVKDTFTLTNYDKRQSPFYPELTFLGDIRDSGKLREALSGSDLVIHLAAEHKDNVEPSSLYYDVNERGTGILLEEMDKLGVNRIIFTSTVAVYGLNKSHPSEEDKTAPFNHYGFSKASAEKLIENWQKAKPGRSATIVRPTVIFGERNRGNVYNLIKQIESGRFLRIGRGTNQKSIAYVGNIVAFIQHLIVNSSAGFTIYNYVDKPDLAINELIEVIIRKLRKRIPSFSIPYAIGLTAGYGFDLIGKVLGKELPISSIRVRKFCSTTSFDGQKALASGFIPPYSIIAALERTLEFEFLSEREDFILFESE